jgi:hypothetical protein
MAQIPNLPNDPLPNQYCYQYNSDGSNFRIAAQLESPGNANIAQNDGGLYAQYYEGYSAPSLIWLGWVKYASAAGGNWSSDSGTWVTSSGGSTVTTHPIAGDTVYLDANSGNVTVDTASATDNIDATGYTGALTLNAGLTIYGNLKFVAGMTFTPNTQTVTFAATTTGKTITTGGKTFYNVTWNGPGGEWALQDYFEQLNASTTWTAGTLNLNGKEYLARWSHTIGNGFTLNIGAGNFHTNYNGVFNISTGATVTITTGSINIAALTISGAGVFTVTGAAMIYVDGNISINTSSYCNFGTSTIIQFRGSTLLSNQSFYNYQLSVPSSYTNVSMNLQSNLTILNNFTIAYYAGQTRNFLAGSYTLNIGGNFTNNDTFTAGTSTVNFNDATKTSTISGSTTFNNLTSSTSDKTIKFTAGTTQTVSSLSLTGTSGHLITIDTDTGAGTFNLSDTTGTNTLYYTSVTRSAAAGGATWNALISDGNSNGGSNSGWNF